MAKALESDERESLLLRGTLDLCVLALLNTSPTHAYGVVRLLHDHGFSQTSYGTVYPLVSRLRRQGLLDQDVVASAGGPARHVLSLTDEGRTALRDWTSRWREVSDRVAALLGETR